MTRVRGAAASLALGLALAGAGCLDAPPGGGDGGGDQLQLLENPFFEDGNVGWILSGAPEIGGANDLGAPPPPSGTEILMLGDDDDHVDLAFQVVAIPEWSTAIQVTGQRCLETDESDLTAFDYFTVAIAPAAGGDSEVLLQESNLDASRSSCEWAPFVATTGAHAGEELYFQVSGTTDDGTPSTFYADSIELTVYR